MAGLAGAIGTGVMTAAMTSNPIGWAVGGIGAVTSLLGAGSKRQEALDQLNILSGQRASATEALGNLGQIEEQKIGIAQDQSGTAASKASLGVGSSLFSATRTGMTAASNIGFASSGQLNRQLELGQRDIITDYGFQRKGLQDVLGQNLLNISQEIGGQRSQLETQIASIDAETAKARRQASGKGFLQSLLGG
jgi:hypothetical protein